MGNILFQFTEQILMKFIVLFLFGIGNKLIQRCFCYCFVLKPPFFQKIAKIFKILVREFKIRNVFNTGIGPVISGGEIKNEIPEIELG